MVQNVFSKVFRQGSAFFILMMVTIFFAGGPGHATENDLGETNPVYSNNPVVAVVEGKTIHLNDLRDAQIHELMVQVFQLQKRKLVEKTMKVLGEKYPDLKLSGTPKVTKEEIVNFYQSTPEVKSMGPLEQWKENIRDYLKRLKREKYLKQVAEKFNRAASQGHVKNYLVPPTDFKLVVGLGTAMRWFPSESDSGRKVFLLEYSDFECPFCKRVQPTLAKLRKKYSNNVQFGYRHFPLPLHKEATSLAEAVECARDQGRFWEFHNLVYQNSAIANGPDGVFNLARKAGIQNIKGFEDCWSAGKYRKRVQEDVQAGVKIGIRGTPTFIIGQYDPGQGTVSGEMFSGAVPEDKFVKVIEKYLTQ